MAAVNPTYLAGYKGVAKIDGTSLPFKRSSKNRSTAKWDATNALTAGNEHPERGINSLSGSLTVVALDTADALAIEEGLVYPIEILRKTGRGESFNALIDRITEEIDVSAGTTYTIEYTRQGASTPITS